ncbi:hypothetical protein DFH11DRAFT_1727079 [Phellopilus nigrolimitatus]|nr:hypothetical protein DFH11DRAFT_1727079 [Phellopilus nigrolimitatus]
MSLLHTLRAAFLGPVHTEVSIVFIISLKDQQMVMAGHRQASMHEKLKRVILTAAAFGGAILAPSSLQSISWALLSTVPAEIGSRKSMSPRWQHSAIFCASLRSCRRFFCGRVFVQATQSGMPVETRRGKRLRLGEEQQPDLVPHRPKRQKRNPTRKHTLTADRINTLPDEILSLIFETTYQLYSNDSGSPTLESIFLSVRLSHVSRRFRNVSLATPRLWLSVSDAQPPAAIRAFVQRAAAVKSPMKLILFSHINSHPERINTAVWEIGSPWYVRVQRFIDAFAQAIADLSEKKNEEHVFYCCRDCARNPAAATPDWSREIRKLVTVVIKEFIGSYFFATHR